MEPTTALACRTILDRLRAQVEAHLPPCTLDYTNTLRPASAIPIERLPTVGAVVQQLIEAEAVYANALSQPSPTPDASA
jgi:hypothetical protein